MAKLSCNISTNEIEELVSNSDSEEQCTSNVSDIECTHAIRTVMILMQQRLTEKPKTGIK
jgi:hypothetical protein